MATRDIYGCGFFTIPELYIKIIWYAKLDAVYSGYHLVGAWRSTWNHKRSER